MAITFVAHNTPEPALYGAMASILAESRQVQLAHIPVVWDLQRYPDACQFVTSNGALVTSGLLWYERLSGSSTGEVRVLDDLLARHGSEDWVIPLGPSQLQMFTRLARKVKGYAVDYELITVERAHQGFHFSHGAMGGFASHWWRDRYGRWMKGDATRPLLYPGRPLVIAFLGSHLEQTNTYPATLAALGDVSDLLNVSLDVRFIRPEQCNEASLENVDAILLPGSYVPHTLKGQCIAALYGLEHGIPTLALGQGLQAMIAAIAQHHAVSSRNPYLELFLQQEQSFVPQQQRQALGDRVINVMPDSLLASILGSEAMLRHQGALLLPEFVQQQFEANGGMISACDSISGTAAAVELPSHPFFVGVQGRPELLSRLLAAHPLFTAFIKATH
jgi:CTP synthase